MRHVIIGAGPAGVTAAETIRQHDATADIAVVSDEPGPPYARMAIPYLLNGTVSEEGTQLRKAAQHYDQLAIRLVTGRVQSVSPSERQVHLADGDVLAYDRLLVATGSQPVRPAIDGLDREEVATCWTLTDARHIAERAGAGSKVVLAGAGFIGCTVLDALADRGVELTVLEQQDQLLPRMLTPAAASLVQAWCERRGVRVCTGAEVAKVEPANGAGVRLTLAGGDHLEASLVVLATGVRPAVGFLEGSGLEVDHGLLVDGAMRTNAADHFAAGDVAQGPNLQSGKRNVHAIQPAAVEQGRIAALNMVGGHATYHGSLLMNLLQTVGLISCSLGQWQSANGEQCCESIDERASRYVRLVFDDDHLIGAQTVGHSEHLGVLRGLVQSRVSLGPWKQRLLRSPQRLAEAYVARTVP